MAHSDFIALTQDERELVEYAMEGDWFFRDGWAKYGEDWPAYVPNNINVFTAYYFNMVLLPHQLHSYYCPIADMMIHGGRYSAKTVGLAIGNASWTVLHPGNNWLHVSPSLDQAFISYQKILEWGEAGMGNFVKTFVRHYREAPAPAIWFKRWDDYDPGSEIQFRSIGQKPMELLRSFEAGRLSGDEAFRTQGTDGPYRIMTGMARGPNSYALNAKPELKKEYDELAFQVASETDPILRKKLQVVMDNFAEEHGLSKDIRIMLYGNVGAYTWEWERFNWGERNPSKRWAVTWTSDDNPYVTEKQRELLRQQYRDDPDGLRVEMLATRPIAVGDIFTGEHLATLLDGDLDAAAIQAMEEEQPFWRWQQHSDYGVVWYAKPPEKQAVYVASGDPGAGRVPHRNKWVNMVWRIDRRPFELVYMHTGNLSREGQGSIFPWIMDCKRILRTYRVAEGHFAAEAGGPQKNVHQVVWPEELRIIPLNMNSIKATLIMEAQLILRSGLLVAPNIALLEQEMLAYKLEDRKLAQDFVMAMLAAVYVIWPYVAEEFELEGEEEETEHYVLYSQGRDVRDVLRDMRFR